jgi:hypothetical protein
MAEQMISDADLFIDFGATEGGTGGAAILLEYVTNMKVTDERGVETKKTIGGRRKGAKGYIRKKGGGKIMLTELRHASPKVSWNRLWDDDKVFMLVAQDDAEDGVREKWFGVTVSKADRGMDDEGNHTNEIELAFLYSEESVESDA